LSATGKHINFYLCFSTSIILAGIFSSSMNWSALQEAHIVVNVLSVCRIGAVIEFSDGSDCRANGIGRTCGTGICVKAECLVPSDHGAAGQMYDVVVEYQIKQDDSPVLSSDVLSVLQCDVFVY
jgi:hypothetical protein